MNLEKIAFWRNDPLEDLADSLARIRGDADAIALLPYDDGTLWLKPAHFDKELIGGQGGYETNDGDKIVLDGEGNPVREFMGVKIVSALDPTEHAGAVDHVKAMMAHKKDIGEWLKVDKRGNIIEAGEALVQADDSDIDVGVEGTAVEERAGEIATQSEGMTKEMAYDRAMSELEKEGEVTKIMDIAPPSGINFDENGDLDLDQATHIAVDLSKGADLMPTTTSTTELNTALDKARMEEYEEGKYLKYMIYGIIIGTLITVFGGGIFLAANSLL